MRHGILFFFDTDVDLDLLVREIGEGNLIFKNPPKGDHLKIEWIQCLTNLIVIKELKVKENLSLPISWEPQNQTRHDIPFDKEDIDYVRNALQGIKSKHGCYALCLIVESSLKLGVIIQLIHENNITLKNLPEGAYFESLEAPDRAKFSSVPRFQH